LLTRSISQIFNSDHSIAGYILGGVSGDMTDLFNDNTNIGETCELLRNTYLNTSSYLLIKLNANMQITGHNVYDLSYWDMIANAFQVAPGGGFVFGGTTFPDYSSSVYKLLKTNFQLSSTLEWEKTFNQLPYNILLRIQPSENSDGFMLAGITGDLDTDFDFWIVRTGNSGNPQWSKRIGGNNDELFFLGGFLATYGQRFAPEEYHTALCKKYYTFMPYRANIVQGDDPRDYVIAGMSNSDISGDKSENRKGGVHEDYWIIKFGIGSNRECNTLPICLQWMPFQDKDIPEITPPHVPDYDEQTAIYISSLIESQLAACQLKNENLLKQDYLAQCLYAEPGDSLELLYGLPYHHYTLYYHDRAGNLVKTVPPKGVELQDLTQQNIKDRQVHPNHSLVTKYEYNSLGQLIMQATPDGGASNFIYNKAGQLRFSQNAQQKDDYTFSYTKYDELGRVIETGENEVINIKTLKDPIYLESPAHGLLSYPVSKNTQRSVTVYNEPFSGITYAGQPQRYLQNRVSYIYADEDGTDKSGDEIYTCFSYDPHGNVEWMVQIIPGLPSNYIAYEYDLISSNVLKVKYNEGMSDQFYHRYQYDADNRLTVVETSRDGKLWDKDARYQYYKHGPLARTVIGEDNVQGLDYIYTLQGWLKAVNHPLLDAEYDPSKDGLVNTTGKDIFAMSLSYYGGDFVRAGSPFDHTNTTNLKGNDLYNGNISAWTSHTGHKTGLKYEQLTGNIYKYDHLNRLLSSNFNYFTGSQWTSANNDYKTQYSYDANGNINTLVRFASTKKNLIDRLGYNYIANTNQLSHIDDVVSTVNVKTDLEDQQAGNYRYDKTGNLIGYFGGNHQNQMDSLWQSERSAEKKRR